jgi:hypothetical protein
MMTSPLSELAGIPEQIERALAHLGQVGSHGAKLISALDHEDIAISFD